MDKGEVVIQFPQSKLKSRKAREQSKADRFGLTPPGYILRLPKDLAGDFDKQCAACALLRTLTAVWLRRLRRENRPLASRELTTLLTRAASGGLHLPIGSGK